MRAARGIRDELREIALLLAVIWGAFLVQNLPYVHVSQYGLRPRTLVGLLGIGTMPFLHGGLGHLLGNTVSLFILLVLLAASRIGWHYVVAAIVVLSGTLLWLIGRGDTVHIGASALVFGLITFLIFRGIFQRQVVPVLIAVVVGCLYGTTLLWGVLPLSGDDVSWDGHLCGTLAGGLVAYALATRPRWAKYFKRRKAA